MFSFDIRTGRFSKNRMFIANGYAGHGEGKNNPAMQAVASVGPLPVGRYKICGHPDTGLPYDSPKNGKFVLRLEPDPSNAMHDREAFRIHGDSIAHPGTASEGCIILPRPVREAIWKSGDRDLEVVASSEPKETIA